MQKSKLKNTTMVHEKISCDACGRRNMGIFEVLPNSRWPVHTKIKCTNKDCNRNYESYRPEKEETSAFKLDLKNAETS